ncbi:hypothetical protein Vadar_016797 [Vaccinium darrowii]|uniref:Uncharacterized protein n=1 Tax=Vaccinium darrowii TaxID=229202 RepID=A0ACB7ZD63_9ERIC|nr:hypothetical protein Vadar_016797 [Vaccinium darrowii]
MNLGVEGSFKLQSVSRKSIDHFKSAIEGEQNRNAAVVLNITSNLGICRSIQKAVPEHSESRTSFPCEIWTIQLEYTDAKESLLQAARKAPVAALGFQVQCNKWAVIVRLLLEEIPERTVFMQKGMEKALRPYFELTNAVRVGDLKLFKAIAEKFSTTFCTDGTQNLIVRLQHNVTRTGLRNISISYSRISLTDVAKKLRLDSENPVADAKSIVAKAIRNGAIDATLDHATVHALRFPPNSDKEKESAEKRRERQQQEQELARHIAEEDDDEF